MNSSLAFMIDEATARKRGPVRPPLKTAKAGTLVASLGPGADSGLIPEVGLIAVSACMQDIAAFAWRLAHSEAPIILIEGERGTGRETVARAIHYQSRRRDRPVTQQKNEVDPGSQARRAARKNGRDETNQHRETRRFSGGRETGCGARAVPPRPGHRESRFARHRCGIVPHRRRNFRHLHAL